MALLGLDKFTRNGLNMLFCPLSVSLRLHCLLLSLADGHFLFRPHLLRLLPGGVTTDVQLGLISFYKVLAPSLRVEDLTIGRCGASWLALGAILPLSIGFSRFRLAWAPTAALNRNALVPIAAVIGAAWHVQATLAVHLDIVHISLWCERNRLLVLVHFFVVDNILSINSFDAVGITGRDRRLFYHSCLHFFCTALAAHSLHRLVG